MRYLGAADEVCILVYAKRLIHGFAPYLKKKPEHNSLLPG